MRHSTKNSRYPRGIGSVCAEDQTHELAQPRRGGREIVLPLPMLRSLWLAGWSAYLGSISSTYRFEYDHVSGPMPRSYYLSTKPKVEDPAMSALLFE